MRRGLSALLGIGLLVALAGPVAPVLWGQPIETVRVTGPFVHVSKQALEAAIGAHLPRTFLMVDVDAIRRAARALPGVEEVSVRRVWPDRLEVEVRECEAVASWQGRILLQSDGLFCEPESLESASALPELAGPPGRWLEVLERYRQLDRITQQYLEARVSRLEAQGHGAWVAELDNGIVVQLGSDAFEDYLPIYAQAFPRALGPHLHEVKTIDLRYGSGFAVRWRQRADTGEDIKA